MRTLTQQFSILALAALAGLIPQNAYAVSVAAQQVTGEVLVAKAAAPEAWSPITSDTPLVSGDSVKTKDGSCSIVYSDQATFAVEPNTTLTLETRADAEDIKLLLGKIKGKVNHQNVTQSFIVTTPAAVATVRGTEVDFAFDKDGNMTVDLHNGNVQVVNEDAEMKIDLEGGKSISIKYDKMANTIRIKNECGSDGVVTFNLLGREYAESPCGEKEIDLSTAEIETSVPGTTPDVSEGEQPDEGRRATDSLS